MNSTTTTVPNPWTVQDSRDLYQIFAWGNDYFGKPAEKAGDVH